MLETIQYSASPASKFSAKTPNMPGMIQSIVRFCCSCWGVAAGMVDIFCITHVDRPTSTGIRKGNVPALESSPRSIHNIRPLIGIASLTTWSHGYRCLERSARRSGVVGSVARNTE